MSITGKTYCSGSVTGTMELTWIINYFTTLKPVIGQKYVSENYHPEGNPQDKFYWYLEMYPGGDCRDYAGFISLHLLYNHSYVNQFYVIATFTIRNAEGETLCRQNLTRDFSSIDVFGFRKLIKREELIRKMQGHSIIIDVQVTYSLSAIRNVDSVKLVLDDGSLHKKLREDLKAFLKNKETSDAVISVDGVDIPVHTSILSARSKVFAAMFQYDTIESTCRRVEITDFKLDTVKSLLQYIYSASVDDINVDLAVDLLKAADKYDLADLLEYCSNYLMAHEDDKHIAQILTTADMCNAPRLREDAIRYFCTKIKKFDLEEHRSFLIHNPELLLDVIQRLKRISIDGKGASSRS